MGGSTEFEAGVGKDAQGVVLVLVDSQGVRQVRQVGNARRVKQVGQDAPGVALMMVDLRMSGYYGGRVSTAVRQVSVDAQRARQVGQGAHSVVMVLVDLQGL